MDPFCMLYDPVAVPACLCLFTQAVSLVGGSELGLLPFYMCPYLLLLLPVLQRLQSWRQRCKPLGRLRAAWRTSWQACCSA